MDEEYAIVIRDLAGAENSISIRSNDDVATIKKFTEEQTNIPAHTQILMKEGDCEQLPNGGVAKDLGIVADTVLVLLILDALGFGFSQETIDISNEGRVATKNGLSHAGVYQVACAERPFPMEGTHTQRMKIVCYKRNVLFGAIYSEDGDITEALRSHRNDGYNYGYIGNGPNGYVYDADGDLSANGRQINSFGDRNSRLRAGDVLDMVVDTDNRTISFVHNGVPQPSKFTDIKLPVYFAAALSSSGESVELTPTDA